MWYNKEYTTLRWLMVWSSITAIMAWFGLQTQQSWTFYIVVATFIILIGGLVWQGIKILNKKRKIKSLELWYLIPKEKYPSANFPGAPEQETRTEKLVVGIGQYRLLHRLIPKIDVLLDALVLRFDGSDKNKPICHGTDNPYIVEVMEKPTGKVYKDWWGDIQPINASYPRYVHAKDCLAIGNRVETKGEWKGKAYFEVPIRNERVIKKELVFEVSEDPNKDQIPFLKVQENEAKSN